MEESPHIPVLLNEVISNLNIDSSGTYLDCTIGFGGHAMEILNRLNKKGKLIGIDLDSYALKQTEKLLLPLNKSFYLDNKNFQDFPNVLKNLGIEKVNGILLDLGFSSYQVDSKHKGLSYRFEAPLDMRFNKNSNITASRLIRSLSESELSKIILEFGEEYNHKKIARSIKSYSSKNRMNTTLDLKNAITKVSSKKKINKTLSRVFQAIRIKVNEELEVLENTLKKASKFLSKGGRILVISFHSIEDRIIKHFFKDKVIYKNSSYDIEFTYSNIEFKILTKKPIIESLENKKRNSRSRSAKLRVAERVI